MHNMVLFLVFVEFKQIDGQFNKLHISNFGLPSAAGQFDFWSVCNSQLHSFCINPHKINWNLGLLTEMPSDAMIGIN